MVTHDLVAIEGNKKFRLKDENKNFDFFDTVKVFYPNEEFDKVNKIFLQFEDSQFLDSIYFVNSHSEVPSIFYKQIFYSSVIIHKLNDFSENPVKFRIDQSKLVSKELLETNDSLIIEVLNYFNLNIDKLGLAECGRNSMVFKKICDDYSVPCRLVNLQGGDVDQVGFDEYIGYPLHVVCEIYSSKNQKWYVIDPSFGSRFKRRSYDDYLSAVEISNKHSFRRDSEIEQDSILLTKKSIVDKDYFKFYENVIFTDHSWKNKYLRKVVSLFYSRFNYFLYLYSNNLPIVKNGFYYVIIKTFIYIFMITLYVNVILILLLKRLFLVKKPKN